MAPLLRESVMDTIVSPYDELIAYEYLYSQDGSTLKKIVESTVRSGRLPHEAVRDEFGMILPDSYGDVEDWVSEHLGTFRIVVNRTPSWPKRLEASTRPSPILYYKGDIALLEARNVSIVGARKATDEGLARAAKLARALFDNDIVVTTGLAAGIDTAATTAALECDATPIGVIGTPIDQAYPKENATLQEAVAEHGLVVSQVPLYKYSKQPFRTKRFYFPERNELMAAISDATVIVEASDTSGTLTQARACLHQGRPLFIMRSCAEGAASWPSKYLDKDGVYILDSAEQLIEQLYQ